MLVNPLYGDKTALTLKKHFYSTNSHPVYLTQLIMKNDIQFFAYLE